VLRAELRGSNCCSANGLTSIGRTPVLNLCRDLIAAGHDPTQPLHVFREGVQALTVRTVGEGARLTVDDHHNVFANWKPWKGLAATKGANE
jgi:hypothetical protein